MLTGFVSQVDWTVVANETGYKDANNAKTMFSRFKKKYVDAASTDSDGNTPSPSKPKRGGAKKGKKDEDLLGPAPGAGVTKNKGKGGKKVGGKKVTKKSDEDDASDKSSGDDDQGVVHSKEGFDIKEEKDNEMA